MDRSLRTYGSSQRSGPPEPAVYSLAPDGDLQELVKSFPSVLQVMQEDGEAELAVNWELLSDEGEYRYRASLKDGDCYQLAEGVRLPVITVQRAEPIREMVPALFAAAPGPQSLTAPNAAAVGDEWSSGDYRFDGGELLSPVFVTGSVNLYLQSGTLSSDYPIVIEEGAALTIQGAGTLLLRGTEKIIVRGSMYLKDGTVQGESGDPLLTAVDYGEIAICGGNLQNSGPCIECLDHSTL